MDAACHMQCNFGPLPFSPASVPETLLISASNELDVVC